MPKAVPRTQGQWVQIARIISEGMALTRNDRVATAQPLYYGDPLYCFFASILSGSTMIMLDRFRSQTFVELLVRTRTTKILTIGVVPTMIMNTPVSDVEHDLCLEAAWSVGIPREIHGDLGETLQVPVAGGVWHRRNRHSVHGAWRRTLQARAWFGLGLEVPLPGSKFASSVRQAK